MKAPKGFGELEFIDWIRRVCRRSPSVRIGIGDDAAVVRVGSRDVVVTTDILVDGVHFDSRRASPAAIGRKAMAKNLSDIAAMGCLPTYAVVSAALPKTISRQRARGILLGLERTARRYGVYIIGGDTVSHAGPLTLNVALMGEARGVRPVTRSGAKVGDVIMVTGPMGGSIRGKHLTFVPRVREGYRLNKNFRIHAMIDISDGLILDLWRICRESRVGAVLDGGAIPVSRDAHIMAGKGGLSPLEHALADGEDYELLFTVSPDDARKISKRRWAVAIGECITGRRVFMRDAQGIRKPLLAHGYEHRFKG